MAWMDLGSGCSGHRRFSLFSKRKDSRRPDFSIRHEIFKRLTDRRNGMRQIVKSLNASLRGHAARTAGKACPKAVSGQQLLAFVLPALRLNSGIPADRIVGFLA